MIRRSVLLLAAFILVGHGHSVSVHAFFGKKSAINTTWSGVAIKGYDPVAYFTEGRPMKGQKKLEHEWNGATWRFANAKHLELFRADPEAYAPQYGGY